MYGECPDRVLDSLQLTDVAGLISGTKICETLIRRGQLATQIPDRFIDVLGYRKGLPACCPAEVSDLLSVNRC